MSIVIEDGVCIPKKEHKVPERVTHALEAYAAAYVAVYGVPPTMYYEEPWVRVQGVTNRVRLHRLREMTQQLKYRAG